MKSLKQLALLTITFLSFALATPININSATPEEMVEKLPGIGSVKAEAIIEYRQDHGDFKDKNELLNVSGIGEKTYNEIKDKIEIAPSNAE